MASKNHSKRVCIIGAGPSGMSVLHHMEKLKLSGFEVPEVICYEKQSDWGGLWNYTWRTGLDEYGEAVHGSMYRHLWSNGPKEALEFPDYTFEEHFGKPIPSFPPREVLFDYLQGRWRQNGNLRSMINFSHVVRSVQYNDSTDDFVVILKNLKEDCVLAPQRFDYVITATGHYSTPHFPSFPGIEEFPGRVMHAHDFREAKQFKGKRLLLVGSSYSAEDIALQCLKYGAESIICSWRTRLMGFHWPSQISERPLLAEIKGSTCTFKDGFSCDVDAIIMCTGYLHNYPFLSDNLRLTCPNVLYPPCLYKGVVWTEAANGKLLYVGAQDQYYTYTMFDAQGCWVAKYIVGDIKIPDTETRRQDCKSWVERNKNLKDCHDEIKFQTDYVNELAAEANYGFDIDVAAMFDEWEGDKHDNILTYRDKCFVSKFTGNKSPCHHTTFMKAFDDSIATYVSQEE